MIRILHLSDTHFGTEVPPVVDALVRAADLLAPNLVICSGDLTQRAKRRQFESAAAFLGRFGDVPRMVIPGNHDIPLWNVAARVVSPYTRFRSLFGALESSHEMPLAKVVALNTTHPSRHKNGAITSEHVEQTCRQLASASPRQLRIVVTHHPLYVPAATERHNEAAGNRLAAQRWANAGVDLVMGGHIHLPYFTPVPRAFVNADRSFWVAQAGTAVSHRVRAGFPNSFNIVEWDGVTCTLQRWDFNSLTMQFERRVSQEMPVAR